MRQSPTCAFFQFASFVSSVLGIIFFFSNPTVTIYCACICILNSLIQVTSGSQNNIGSEIFTIIVAMVVAAIIKKPMLDIVVFAICLSDIAFLVLGYVFLILAYLFKR